jgi:hypothetical protein
MINRREILNIGVSAAAASFLTSTETPADEQPDSFRIIDTNVSLFRWPFRRLPLDAPSALVTKLRSLGISKAWAGSFEGLLHRDVAGVNERLAEACGQHPELVPIGSLNVELPSWESDLRRCVKDHNMPGIRLHPNYHGYTLDDPRFAELLEQATSAGRFVQIAAAMEDTRTQHPTVVVPDVNLAPLPDLIQRIRNARVQILNHRLRGPLLERLAQIPGIFFDTARVDSTDGVPKLAQTVPPGRVMFGTHAPFLIPQAALIRVHESGQLDADGLAAVLSKNAESFGKPSA